MTFIIVTAIASMGLCVASCGNGAVYKNYKNYQKGYEAARNGKSKPFFWASKAEKEGHQAGLKDVHSRDPHPSTVEFQYTEKELGSLGKAWPTFDKMLDEAMRGNADALFAVGLCYLYGGNGLPIDLTRANMFFANAASLGHAPALDKIRALYVEDDPNIFLHQVYVNLVIAMGHTEYTLQYHQTRSEMKEKFGEHGQDIVEEIERIAEEKLNVIYKNQDDLKQKKKSNNTHMYSMSLHNITMLDSFYDIPHWFSIAEPSGK